MLAKPLTQYACGMAAALVGAACLAGPAAAVAATVESDPPLNPAWSSSRSDFTTTCAAGSVRVTVAPQPSKPISVDGGAASQSTRTVTVPLQPGQRFVISEGTGSSAVDQSVRCLPADFPKFDVVGTLPASTPRLALGFVRSFAATSNQYAIVLDSKGVPIWWKNTPGFTPIDVKPVSGRRIGFWQGELDDRLSEGAFKIVRLDGSLDRSVSVVGGNGDLHESTPTSRGTVYRIAGTSRPGVDLTSVGGGLGRSLIDQRIQEIDSTGKVIWSWSTAGRFKPVETGSRWWDAFWALGSPDPLDAYHLNSVEEDGKGGLIVSSRHLNSVFRIRKSTGAIDWRLGGYPTSKTLKIVGDKQYGSFPLGAQHDARVQPDGTITVFDNGPARPRPSRVTRWRINTKTRTATLVESFTDTTATALAMGSARRSASDGSWVVSWGAPIPVVRAYDKRHRMVFGIGSGASGYVYRAAPITTSFASLQQFRAGMDSMYPRG